MLIRAFTALILFATPSVFASVESDSIQSILTTKMYVRLADQILETNSLGQLYSLNNFQPFWTAGSQLNSKAAGLRQMLVSASRHGLISEDYWSPTLEKLYTGINEKTWLTFELAASEAYIRYARQLTSGRLIDPNTMDDDIKFSRKEFKDYQFLKDSALQTGLLFSSIDQLAPQMEAYSKLLTLLQDLRTWSAQKQMPTLFYPGKDIALGQRGPFVAEIKIRLNQLGYGTSNTSDIFDSELAQVIKVFQSQNGIKPTGTLGKATMRSLGMSANDRIKQVEVTLEKLRWLPREIEPKHVFVNLAFQELKVRENNKVVLQMKTVNGRPLRRSPSMRDLLTVVEINPTWTVPFSIAIKDKLPMLQKNPNYITEHHFKLYDSRTDEELDPKSVDWIQVSKQNFYYTLIQQSSRENALGVMKFPLTNEWHIYLHDTNEPQLMKENFRLMSSGCIRLEDPMGLGLYLLKDQPQWTENAIIDLLPQGKHEKENPANVKIRLTQAVPVYTMYLTVEVNQQGQTRFVEDHYGQDWRLKQTLSNKRVKNETF